MADLLDCLGRWSRSAQYCHGLNPAQWESLRFLGRANRLSSTPGDLAKYLGTTRGTASQTVLALTRKGYVTKAAKADDRRVAFLELTPEGRKILKDDPLKWLNQTLAGMMGPQELASATKLLSQVMGCFQGADLGQSFGTCERCGYFVEGAGSETSQCLLKKSELTDEDVAGLCVNFSSKDRESAPA
jgi:DNA-binding MarR family transcriptional regulator